MNNQIMKFGRGFRPVLANERGMAFVTTVLLLLILGLLVTVSTQWSATDIKRTANYTKTREAFFIADAGLQDAINHMNYTSTGQSPGAAADNFQQALTNWPSGFTSGINFQNGTYWVNIDDNDDGDSNTSVDTDFTVLATAVGIKNEKTTTIEATLHLPRAMGDAAILAENPVDAHGTGDITGENGMIHSNTSVDINGATTVTGGATSAGSCTAPAGIDCYGGPEYERDIPKIFPRDFKDYARYVFYKTSGGNQARILDRGNLISDPVDDIIYKPQGPTWVSTPGNNPPTPATIFDAFNFNPGQGWQNLVNVVPGTNAPNDAFIYFTEDFDATANIGALVNPWSVTIMAEGDIKLNGTVYMENCTTACSSDEAIQNLFLIAEDDLSINQIDSPEIHGIISALDQFHLGGNAEMKGIVIAADFTGTHKSPYDPDPTVPKSYDATDSNLVQSTTNSVAGTMSLTYDGPIVLPVVENKVRILTWKEL